MIAAHRDVGRGLLTCRGTDHLCLTIFKGWDYELG
jgi:hypothetical protein